MRWRWKLGMLLALAMGSAIATFIAQKQALISYAGLAAPGGTRTPVLVELFTSEGCSSCPPADALLMRLEKEQPVGSAEIIVLSEHVDYWDSQGWKDPFSSRQFSDRQSEYARAHASDEVYTPQMIVDGSAEFTGSNERKALGAIAESAKAAKPKVKLMVKQSSPSEVTLHVDFAGAFAIEGKLFVALTETGLVSRVKKGENDGRTLSHTGVVRRLIPAGKLGGKGGGVDVPIKLDTAWKREALRAVAFVQDGKSGKIVGAAGMGLN